MLKRKTDKIANAAHIKRNTRGTSNEISFSVLDAAKNALDEGKDLPTEQAKRFGRISLFTLPIGWRKTKGTPHKDESLPLTSEGMPPTSVSGTPQTVKPTSSPVARSGSAAASASASRPRSERARAVPEQSFAAARRSTGRTSEEEIAWRKARRKKSKVVAGVLAALIVVGLIGAGSWYLYNDNMRYLTNVERLENASTTLLATDETLASLDSALQDPLSEQALQFAESQEQSVEEVQATLEQVEQEAQAISLGLRETREREAADALMVTASARNTMLDQGWAILSAAAVVSGQYERVQAIWEDVLEADALVRDAAGYAAQGTSEATAQSLSANQQAQDELAAARAELEALAAENASFDYSGYLAYIDKRIEALGYAIASDQALQDRNTAEAVTQNDAYNEADKEAANLAANLPADPGQPILDAFEQEIAQAVQSYEAARDQASSSDAFLRDYLG